jgi:putative hydrolase of the HAD superfamily
MDVSALTIREQENRMQVTTIQNVVFDLGGVLFEWRPDKTLARLYADQTLQQRITHEILQHQDWLDLDRGSIDEQQALDRFQARTHLPTAELQNLMHEIRQEMVPMEQTWDIIDWLAQQKIALYVLSNMSLNTFAVLTKRYQRWNKFKGVIISAHHGLMKPEKKFFNFLLTQYGLSAKQTVFIDDLKENVQGAIDTGLFGILFDNALNCRKHIEQLM